MNPIGRLDELRGVSINLIIEDVQMIQHCRFMRTYLLANYAEICKIHSCRHFFALVQATRNFQTCRISLCFTFNRVHS